MEFLEQLVVHKMTTAITKLTSLARALESRQSRPCKSYPHSYLFLSFVHACTYTDVQIGFQKVSYTVNEGKGNVVVEVELKPGFATEVEIPFTITVTAGSAHSEF